MKTSIVLFILVFVLFSCVAIQGAHAQQNDIPVFIDGEKLSFDVPPELVDGRVMVPARAILERLGMTVSYSDNCVFAFGTTTAIILTIGSKTAKVLNESFEMPVAPYISGDRTLVPLRFVAEVLDANVKWDEDTSSVMISTHVSKKGDAIDRIDAEGAFDGW